MRGSADVAALPTATSKKHIAEKTVAYATANKTALSARRFVALGLAMTMITVSGLTILAGRMGAPWQQMQQVSRHGGPLLGQVFPRLQKTSLLWDLKTQACRLGRVDAQVEIHVVVQQAGQDNQM